MIQYRQSDLIVFESALFQTTSTLIRTPDLLLLVDPTWLPAEIETIRETVEAWREDRPLYLLFTHSDYDHILGYRAFPGAVVIASQALADTPDAARQLAEIRKFDDAYYIHRDYPIDFPKVDYAVDHDGQLLEVGGTRLHFFLAPGHNPDGIFTIVENLGIWMVGDYLSNIEFPYIYHSSEAYLQTLEKAKWLLREFPLRVLISGHGSVCTETPEVHRRITESEQYLHQLRLAIAQDQEFPLEQLWKRYDFPGVMQDFHADNVALVKKELGK